MSPTLLLSITVVSVAGLSGWCYVRNERPLLGKLLVLITIAGIVMMKLATPEPPNVAETPLTISHYQAKVA